MSGYMVIINSKIATTATKTEMYCDGPQMALGYIQDILEGARIGIVDIQLVLNVDEPEWITSQKGHMT